MKTPFFILLIVSQLCINKSSTLRELERIETFIQANPAQARADLQAIDSERHKTKREAALYSLLMSMAADKCYIDIKSDTLVNPSVAYYSKCGDKYHKFLAYYYQGRVYENNEDYALATKSFLNAQRSMSSVPDEYKVRLHVAKERVYLHQFAVDKALEETIAAKRISSGISNPYYYYQNCLDIAAINVMQGNYQLAGEELDALDKWISDKGLDRTSKYYKTRLKIAFVSPDKSSDTIKSLLEGYHNACTKEGIPASKRIEANAYVELGDYTQAKLCIQCCSPDSAETLFDLASYYRTLTNICQGTGDFENALVYKNKYMEVDDSINFTVFNNDVRFLEERFADELDREKSKRERSIQAIVIALLSIAVAGALLILHYRKKAYREAIRDARSEFDFIKNIYDNGTDSEESIKEALTKRIQALQPYISGKQSRIIQARHDIESIDNDRQETLRSIGLLYALTYPDFISELSAAGLSSEETGLCVLYLLGYSLKEMNDYLLMPSISHINLSIRRKMNLENNGIKLKTYLKALFEKHYPGLSK